MSVYTVRPLLCSVKILARLILGEDQDCQAKGGAGLTVFSRTEFQNKLTRGTVNHCQTHCVLAQHSKADQSNAHLAACDTILIHSQQAVFRFCQRWLAHPWKWQRMLWPVATDFNFQTCTVYSTRQRQHADWYCANLCPRATPC